MLGRAAATSSRMRPVAAALPGAIENSVAVMTFANITREPAGRLDRHRHRRDGQLGSEEHPRPDDHRARARVRRAAQSEHRRAPQRLAGDRRRPPARRHVGGRRRLPAHRRRRAHHRQLRRGRDRRRCARTVKVDGRIDDIFALQDKIVFELSQGLNVALRGTGDRRHRAARDAVGRGLRELRARDDEPAAGDPRFDRARDCRVRGGDAARPRLRDGVGGARRRLRRSRATSSSIPDMVHRAMEMEQRALVDRSGARRRAQLARHGAAVARPDRRGDRRDPRGASARARQRPGAPGARARLLGRQGGLRRARFRSSSAPSRSIRRPATRTCSSSLLLAWEGQLAGPRTSAAARSSCRSSTSPATSACRWSARTRGSATSTTCRAVRRRDARVRARARVLGASDHALRDRTLLELNVKLGAAYLRQGRARGRRAALRSRAQDASMRASPRAPTIRSRATTSPDLHALRGDADRAFDSLERVARALPALTAARAPRRRRSRVAARRRAFRGDHRAA